MLAWVAAGVVVFIVATVVLMTLRSFRKWQQLPPGRSAEADSAESFLSWMTRSRGDRG